MNSIRQPSKRQQQLLNMSQNQRQSSSSSSSSVQPEVLSFEISSPSAAGIPILEIIRRLEDENIIRKEDRIALNNALSNPSKHDKVLKALCDIELGVNVSFAIKKLKAMIYQGDNNNNSSTNNNANTNNGYSNEFYGIPVSGHNVTFSSTSAATTLASNISSVSSNDSFFAPSSSSSVTATPNALRNDTNESIEPYDYGDDESPTTAGLNRMDFSAFGSNDIPMFDFNNSLLSEPNSEKADNNKRKLLANIGHNGVSFNAKSNLEVNAESRWLQMSPVMGAVNGLGTQSALVITAASSSAGTASGTALGIVENSSSRINFISDKDPISASNRTMLLPSSNDPATFEIKKQRKKSTINLPSGEIVQVNYDTDETIRQVLGQSTKYSTAATEHLCEKFRNNYEKYNLMTRKIMLPPSAGSVTTGSSRPPMLITAAAATAVVGSSNQQTPSSAGAGGLQLGLNSNYFHKEKTENNRKFAIIVGTGSYNPLTRMHLRTFHVAKQYLESSNGYTVLGSLLSPAHYATVRERYRTNISEIIPSPHRLAIAQLMVEDSQWVSIDPWEMTRRRAMDYTSLLSHVTTIVETYFNGDDNDLSAGATVAGSGTSKSTMQQRVEAAEGIIGVSGRDGSSDSAAAVSTFMPSMKASHHSLHSLSRTPSSSCMSVKSGMTQLVPLQTKSSKQLKQSPGGISNEQQQQQQQLQSIASINGVASTSNNNGRERIDIRIFYLCKSNMIPRLSTTVFREGGYGCICVCRPLEHDVLKSMVNQNKWKNLLYIAEDDAILDSSIDTVTSRKVRDKIKSGQSLGYLVGRRVEEYVIEKRLGQKMSGKVEWEEYEKALPSIPSMNDKNNAATTTSNTTTTSGRTGMASTSVSASVAGSSRGRVGD